MINLFIFILFIVDLILVYFLVDTVKQIRILGRILYEILESIEEIEGDEDGFSG